MTREQDLFLLTNDQGNIPEAERHGLGFYARDTRHLSVYDFRLNGSRPIVLLSSAGSGFSQEQVLGNHRFEQHGNTAGRATIELTRERVLNGCLEETLQVDNYNPFPVEIQVDYRFAADFADIFEVRGHQRKHPGKHTSPTVEHDCITYRYLGADGIWRKTAIHFDPAPTSIDEHGAGFVISLGPRSRRTYHLSISVDEARERRGLSGLQHLRREYEAWQADFVQVHTGNEVFNEVIKRSISDLRMLWTRSSHDHSYLAAGTPWYATLFGRDSLIASLQTLPFRPQLARACLALLARHQGQGFNPQTGEEPGKILHEERQNELSMIGELPYRRYYGSVDSTPLFLLLAAEYTHWTGDLETLGSLMQAIEAALAWVRDYGDLDGDGLIEYRTDSGHGLRNQGWKDSIEAIVHADGRLCHGPIALPEVQGYLYLAYQRLAPIFDHIGRPDRAAELRKLADTLQARFEAAFWLDDEQSIAMALDGDKVPSRVMSSNAGQALWGGILRPERARKVCDALFSGEMFSGWGIRTMSAATSTYLPLGYHLGTVWPHDNGIIALGLKQYGMTAEVNEIATAMFDAAQQFPGYRLPELFGGHARTEYHPPVPYPVACRPQAWTAGATLHLLQAILGLRPDALNGRLDVVQPRLPYWLPSVAITGLSVGTAQVNLNFRSEPSGTSVTPDLRGNLQVRISQ
ncbi:MAG: glycogen debranching N-terminal domain-containing protein [Dehalococcoidia bacterium]